jgi:TRAP-type C4-dicarboxylate transport system permease large subunit
MGAVAVRAGMARELYQAANSLFSGLRGALAMGTIGGCAGFGAICGSSLATTATFARVAVPEMQRHGYDLRLATGVVASGGTLGILIPPSIILIIYALFSERSVPEMYAAALFPGIALTLLHIVTIAIIGHLQPARYATCGRWRCFSRLRWAGSTRAS